MNERRFTPRRQYEVVYRALRIENGVPHDANLDFISDEILDCAVLSYDNRQDRFYGFVNKSRLAAFVDRRARRLIEEFWLTS